MTNRRIEGRYRRPTIAVLVLFVASLFGFTLAFAEDRATSIEDRERFVSVIRQLEQDPLNPDLVADRQWALYWLTEAPDISVIACANTLGDLLEGDYRFEREIVVHYLFAIGVRIIEHPEAADDPIAQQLAGVEGALAAYRSILRDEPGAKSPALEEMIEVRDRGEMPDFVREAYTNCAP